MSVDITIPALGESVTEATIAKLHKKTGEAVAVDELLVELETDKVTLEVNAPASGTIGKLKVQEGDTVEVGDVIGSITEGEVKPTAPQKKQEKPESGKALEPQAEASSSAKTHEGVMSPAAQKISSEHGLQGQNIPGTGKDGRITKGDVIGALNNQCAQTSAEIVPQSQNEVREHRVRMTKLRQTIAARLKESQNTAAILSTFNEVDMSQVFRIRKTYQELFQKKHEVKLGFMSFFVKATVAALKEMPEINAEIEGTDLVYKNYYDIGVAVGTSNGLVVPVVRDADKLSFAEIEKTIAELGKKAREGKLSMQEMTGGTFSITNGGTYGSLLSTPIINPPQSGILGMHNIVQRPVAVDNQVVIRPMMYIALSYDHRIVDGKQAVTFLVRIKELIENPEKLLFDI